MHGGLREEWEEDRYEGSREDLEGERRSLPGVLDAWDFSFDAGCG